MLGDQKEFSHCCCAVSYERQAARHLHANPTSSSRNFEIFLPLREMRNSQLAKCKRKEDNERERRMRSCDGGCTATRTRTVGRAVCRTDGRMDVTADSRKR